MCAFECPECSQTFARKDDSFVDAVQYYFVNLEGNGLTENIFWESAKMSKT